MKRKHLLFTLLLLYLNSDAQTPLSQDAIKDFSSHLLLQFKYGTDWTRQLINYSLAREGYKYEYAVTVIENVNTNKVYREVMLKCIYSMYKSRDQIFEFLYSLEMSAVHATEIADYTFEKYSKVEQVQQEENIRVAKLKEKKDAESKEKYEIEHADEIRIEDSLRKVKQEEEEKEKLAEEEKIKKEAFLNSTPELEKVVALFDKSQEDVVSYLNKNSYLLYTSDKQGEIYIKKGAVNDSLSIVIRFKKNKLQSFLFKTRANNDKLNIITDTLQNILHFEKLYAYVERNSNGEYTGVVRGYNNKEQGIRC